MSSKPKTPASKGPVRAPHGGKEGVAAMLAHLDEAHREKLLGNLAQTDAQLVTELRKGVKDRLVRFEDLARLDVRALQSFLASVPQGKLALALRGAPPEFRAAIRAGLTARAGQLLDEEVDLLGPRAVSDVQRARREVAELAQAAGLLPLQTR